MKKSGKKSQRPNRKPAGTPKVCLYCVEKKEPWFSDAATLERFITERGKIIGRARTGFCSKHQRRFTTAVKHARHLALLPFVQQV
ncbi:MAG: 30S ribosomal protein S18 [Candidatus Levyibacteriota bacterium]